MAKLPKIDSEGLRLAKTEGAKRVSSVVNVRKFAPGECPECHADLSIAAHAYGCSLPAVRR